MADPMIFQFIGDTLDAPLNTFLSTTVSNVISTFSMFFTAGAVIHIMLLGYSMMWGYVQLPFSTFLKTAAKYAFIAAIALNASNYNAYIVAGINGLSDGFTAAFGSGQNTDTTTIYQAIDSTLGQGFTLGATLWGDGMKTGVSHMGMMFGCLIEAAIVFIATIAIGIPAGGVIVVAKAGLSLMLGIGPVFVALALWPVTARFFDGWLAQALTYLLRIALVAAVMTMMFKGFTSLVTSIKPDGSSDQSMIFAALKLICYAIIMFYIFRETHNVAAKLAGGFSSSAMTLTGMAREAMGSVTTSRRDMRTGIPTSATPLGHIARGNTMLNPAYRKYAMQNLQGNWGRNPGGSIKN